MEEHAAASTDFDNGTLHQSASADFDVRELRTCLGAFVTGVTVITTVDRAGNLHGLTANSFNSVSLEPPLILWSLQIKARSYPVFREAERFTINILAADQVAIAKRFAGPTQDKFQGVPVTYGIGGLPLINDCAAYLECRKEAVYPGGDHAVFLGRVEAMQRSDRKPLAFGGGKYMVVHPHDLGAFSLDLGLTSTAQVDAVRIARPVVEELSRQLDMTVGLAVWGNHGPTIIQWEEGSQPLAVTLRTGLVLPLLTSATGLVFAAYLPPPLTEGFIQAELTAAAQKRTGEGPKTREQAEAMLQDVRNRGIARAIATIVPSVNEQGINAFSAPIFNGNGVPVFALTVMGHSGCFDGSWQNPCLAQLRDVAKQLSQRLGYDEGSTFEAT